MKKLPIKLEKRLQKRKEDNSFRKLTGFSKGVDFYSNDYLGFAISEPIYDNTQQIIQEYGKLNGSTGSRLLSGNHPFFNPLENQLASFHNAPSALLFNSGYDANLGFFSAVPQKGDFILYDEFSHASIRDGLKMSNSRNYKFQHNNLIDLRQKLDKIDPESKKAEIYIVTESVFSMDGDSPDLKAMLHIAEEFNAHFIVDEAHATGVMGEGGQGLVQQLGLESQIFARIHTFGKAMGCHGAVILGGQDLKDYLINFSRSLIYTTALSPHSAATIRASYRYLENNLQELKKLKDNIQYFQKQIIACRLQNIFIASNSAIQVCVVSGNARAKQIAQELQHKGFNVKPILSPTVPMGSERLRFCVHSYNSFEEISAVLKVLSNFVAKDS